MFFSVNASITTLQNHDKTHGYLLDDYPQQRFDAKGKSSQLCSTITSAITGTFGEDVCEVVISDFVPFFYCKLETVCLFAQSTGHVCCFNLDNTPTTNYGDA